MGCTCTSRTLFINMLICQVELRVWCLLVAPSNRNDYCTTSTLPETKIHKVISRRNVQITDSEISFFRLTLKMEIGKIHQNCIYSAIKKGKMEKLFSRLRFGGCRVFFQ